MAMAWSPTARSVSAPSPISSTTPAMSMPGTYGGGPALANISARPPLRVDVSVGLTVAAPTWMRISPGPAWGSGTSTTSRASGPPKFTTPTARMTADGSGERDVRSPRCARTRCARHCRKSAARTPLASCSHSSVASLRSDSLRSAMPEVSCPDATGVLLALFCCLAALGLAALDNAGSQLPGRHWRPARTLLLPRCARTRCARQCRKSAARTPLASCSHSSVASLRSDSLRSTMPEVSCPDATGVLLALFCCLAALGLAALDNAGSQLPGRHWRPARTLLLPRCARTRCARQCRKSAARTPLASCSHSSVASLRSDSLRSTMPEVSCPDATGVLLALFCCLAALGLAALDNAGSQLPGRHWRPARTLLLPRCARTRCARQCRKSAARTPLASC